MEHSREMQFMDIWLSEVLMPEKIVNWLFRLVSQKVSEMGVKEVRSL